MAVTYDSSAAIANVAAATYDDLKARFKALVTVLDAVGAERKKLIDEIRKREAEAELKLRLGTLTPAEKEIYREIINASVFKGVSQ